MGLTRISETAGILSAVALLAFLGMALAEKAATHEIVDPRAFCEAGDVARREESLRSYSVGLETVTEKVTHECARIPTQAPETRPIRGDPRPAGRAWQI